jgi:hypothetical protein
MQVLSTTGVQAEVQLSYAAVQHLFPRLRPVVSARPRRNAASWSAPHPAGPRRRPGAPGHGGSDGRPARRVPVRWRGRSRSWLRSARWTRCGCPRGRRRAGDRVGARLVPHRVAFLSALLIAAALACRTSRNLSRQARHGVKSCAHPVSVFRGQSWSSVRRRPSVARTAGRSKDQEAGASADHGCRSCSVTLLCIERNMEGYAGSQTRRAGVFPDWPPQRCGFCHVYGPTWPILAVIFV